MLASLLISAGFVSFTNFIAYYLKLLTTFPLVKKQPYGETAKQGDKLKTSADKGMPL